MTTRPEARAILGVHDEPEHGTHGEPLVQAIVSVTVKNLSPSAGRVPGRMRIGMVWLDWPGAKVTVPVIEPFGGRKLTSAPAVSPDAPIW